MIVEILEPDGLKVREYDENWSIYDFSPDGENAE